MNTGNKIYQSKNGLVTTIAISLDGEVEYALEGSVFVGGAVIQWIRDGMHLIQDSCDSEYYAQKVPDNGGVYIVPAFTGLGAPYWDMYARGAILGITRGTTQNHIIRAAEESIAYQSADLMWAMEKDTDITISTLKVDGGASRRPLPDAVPVRHPEQGGAAPGHPGDYRPWRGVSGRPCHRRVEGPGRDPQPVALQHDLCPADGRGRAHPPALRLAQGCWPKLRLGRALISFRPTLWFTHKIFFNLFIFY